MDIYQCVIRFSRIAMILTWASNYIQYCIKRSSLGQRKGGLFR